MKDRAPSTQTAAKTLLVALKILKFAGGQLSSKEILVNLKNNSRSLSGKILPTKKPDMSGGKQYSAFIQSVW